MSGFLKAKAEAVTAWVFRQPRGLNAILVVLAVVYILSPIDLIPDFLIGPGQCDDAVAAWFGWQNLKAMVRRSGGVTVTAIAVEDANAR